MPNAMVGCATISYLPIGGFSAFRNIECHRMATMVKAKMVLLDLYFYGINDFMLFYKLYNQLMT
jgi:hypothetical protein